MTAVIQIGNSDDKLTQSQWACFVKDIRKYISGVNQGIHFFGGSENWAHWQDVCVVFSVRPEDVGELRRRIRDCRQQYGQESIALTIGETELL